MIKLNIDDFNAVHSTVTNFFGNPCGIAASPGIVNCNYDLAGKMLQKVYGQSLDPHSTNIIGCIYTISTKEYLSPSDYTLTISSFNNETYANVPNGCNVNNVMMMIIIVIHVVFHDCLQTTKDVGMDYVLHTG